MRRKAWPAVVLILGALFGLGWALGQISRSTRSMVSAEVLPQPTSSAVIEREPPPPTEPPLPNGGEITAPVTVKPQATVNPRPLAPDTKQLQQDLSAINWTFESVDSASLTGTILSREQAIDVARAQYAELPRERNVAGYIGLLSNNLQAQSLQAGANVDPTFATPHLVWIVTFPGVQRQSSGPPGEARKVSNTLNVVIDAKSGTYLMDFVWTR